MESARGPTSQALEGKGTGGPETKPEVKVMNIVNCNIDVFMIL
jgi:hypothetical protein